ncbi:global transactivator [Fusarium agapanthi]|uniref:Global transactivator n=1 Tax=Fusarium agapanthi TaxID=1803897 RepID=A0A9P5BIE8_9HYPO|nr:global transactivator [Fusarium agapanthi]
MSEEPRDPIREAASAIDALTARLNQAEISVPKLPTRYWIGWLQGGDGFVDPKDDTTEPAQQKKKEDQEDGESEYCDDNASETSSLHEAEYTNSMAVAAGYNEKKFVHFFNEIHDDILSKHYAPDSGPIPGLKPTLRLFDHQKRAVASALYANNSGFKGMILADPPGFGKTLSVLSTIAMSTAKSGSINGPCVIVAPYSCCRQWMTEIDNFFGQDQMPSICLLGEALTPTDLWKYKVVVTSYSNVAAEVTQVHKFIRGVDAYNQGTATQPPKRPMLVLLSGMLEQEPQRPIGEWLILDEAHAIKSRESRTYHSIGALRVQFDSCLMMTGTPLDNKWNDAYALISMLHGHPITSFLLFQAAFIQNLSSGPDFPEGFHRERDIQMLDACSLRRPHITVQQEFPDIDPKAHSYQMFKKSRRPGSKLAGWKYLIQAQQYAYHPLLVELKFERDALAREMRRNEAIETYEDQAATDQLVKWKERLEKDENWLSRRVRVITDVVDQHKDRHPDHLFLIVDESIYFLDIVAIALKNRFEPEKVQLEYNGRLGPIDRHHVIRSAFEAESPHVMLATRATGGQGLNLQCFNVVIQCGPWWKAAWELQARGRVYRPGQKKHVYVYELRTEDCLIEQHKIKARNKKDELNSTLEAAITRADAFNLTENSRRRLS